MTTLDDRLAPPSSPAVPDTARLRVVLLLDVLDGRQQQFLQAYEQIRHQVAAVPGHVSDQLCQSLGNSSQWLITSEWESSEPFLEWVESAEHRKMVEPLHGCVRDTRSLRFLIARETPEQGTTKPAAAARRSAPGTAFDPVPTPPLCSGGVVRHAITFTVKPGSEEPVAKLLADYSAPQAQVDDTTRLLRTSLFMHGNRVVRAVEVEGDLGNALRHVASQPEVRAVEQAINPYLEEERDLTDSASARAFFARAALPAIGHESAQAGTPAAAGEKLARHAFFYPVRPGRGGDVVRLLRTLDAEAIADPAHPLAAATVFQREDTVVRVVDVRERPDGMPAAPVQQDGPAGVLRELLVPGEPADPAGLGHGGHPMTPVTDRSSR
ncbi:Antibiotic biosynthesis monooxygenase [Actinacidiphila yanglinensis]|uniref:Antibiotic biosynthesis monooxygenase n=1 Tax=Actinacidiphila yanglinensis TaxID=310779 RepID=A0A1H6D3R4_9ACTN|nr:SchA/CurD-like domain-containing protein [Actinacidiphila yanglinensis]SEG79435.1 Antibiotic biosynthesis monooxygenase [Actinacidiphila yanglinensis]